MTRSDFQPCDACRAKPGTPVFCAGCLHNRRVIAHLKTLLRRVKLTCEDAEADLPPHNWS